MMGLLRTGTVLAFAMLVGGCATSNSGVGAGAPLSFAPVSSADNVYITALHGGLIGQVGDVPLGNADRRNALRAEYKALEAAPGGQGVPWQGANGVTGEVVAATPYQVGSQNCRQYTQTINAAGATTTRRGAACRNPDGTWTPLT